MPSIVDKFGRTLLFLFFLFLFVQGAKMGTKLVIPTIRKISPSLADTLASVT